MTFFVSVMLVNLLIQYVVPSPFFRWLDLLTTFATALLQRRKIELHGRTYVDHLVLSHCSCLCGFLCLCVSAELTYLWLGCQSGSRNTASRFKSQFLERSPPESSRYLGYWCNCYAQSLPSRFSGILSFLYSVLLYVSQTCASINVRVAL